MWKALNYHHHCYLFKFLTWKLRWSLPFVSGDRSNGDSRSCRAESEHRIPRKRMQSLRTENSETKTRCPIEREGGGGIERERARAMGREGLNKIRMSMKSCWDCIKSFFFFNQGFVVILEADYILCHEIWKMFSIASKENDKHDVTSKGN